ncbi:E3 ubiquitin-protein ligase [Wickerhamomyces ciferrii]|uniref:E3 ubiquitin-protein ligase n=1 Tax=Wickerhamomyces ciferrii (strain ATCC 14091 / BCRC 22168 / CBS 111 / JCM 3599 / NBRC 0793 / NRRL Y-1031 F-60-10) TaxID=1206466 RepID=K0KVT5_WICCF|nr:E3 ubiquitin-protein ligase [Wickerhamomyces ciferrii]CCH46077.1 E3 ubiquitin-protein ligase [Wickerhamomyces ciferrii]
MGQYTSRITNIHSNDTSSTSSSPQTSTSSSSSNSNSNLNNSTTTTTNNSQSSLDQLPNNLPSIESQNNSIRRRRSSTYNTSSLPNPRRRRLPRLQDTLRFWQRRQQGNQQQSNQSDLDRDTDSDDLLSNFINELESDSNLRSNQRSSSNSNDPLDISNLAGLASNILSSQQRHQNQHQHQQQHDHTSSSSSNSMSFEHQTEMLSRLLEIAATSTVSNLMGSSQVNGRRFDNTSRLSNQRVLNNNFNTIEANGFDSNFQEFVNALRHGLLTNELNERYNQDNDRNLDRLNDMTFFRAFRFDSEQINSNHGNHEDINDIEGDNNDNNDTSETNTNRLINNDVNNPNVPVMIIGVRSVENHDLNDEFTGIRNNRSDGNNDNDNNNDTIDTNDSGTNSSSNDERNSTTDTTNTTNTTDSNSNSNPRSWVIFVMGNTFAWNHPLLSAPSLMSENPTYEDLLNLQELIGQVKPQVTTKEELQEQNDQLFELIDQSTNQSTTDLKTIELNSLLDERCQICLENFELNQILRNLKNCNHKYHKDCIDNWLLNGKNNCPLCRSKGIINIKKDEHEKELDQMEEIEENQTGVMGSTGMSSL